MSDTFSFLAATANDSKDLAHIHVEGWRRSYASLVDPGFLDSLDEEKRAREWESWLANGTEAILARAPDGAAAGFVSFNKLMTPPPGLSPIRPLYSSEILAIYILPAYWRQGLGRELMRAACIRLREKKHRSLCLWVLEKNTRGVAFYRALGGQKCGKKQIEIGGSALTDICFGWRDTSGLIEAQAASSREG